ncbi:sel1 repeat family protein [Erythrobacter sp. SCSIO 43205]|uniref:tetratricopeptide repeat protein n=1 Tax=Erythrobacter sp. SCSIO 43205 TaxID=2779361 RepID=UPI001CAA2227|nr:tetratricopeptide repeat protein [Erythrobacter sp. SCSIO 43205]UAB78623.1 sel1 repeat family protein [Erythrobacter sp. SCSIO 43205]
MLRTVFLGLALTLSFAFSTGLSAQDSIEALVEKEDYAAAFQKAEAEARAGDSFAHAWLGSFYENGNGVPQDMEKAVHHYRVAIANGEHSYPEWRIGVLIDEGKTKGMLEEAVALFERAAARGYTNAMVSLAVMQATGRGTPEDFQGAFDNYMKAARAGNMHGVQGVGILHTLGQGVAKDTAEGAAWFMVAAVGGNESGRSRYEQAVADMSQSEVNAIRDRAIAIADALGLLTD